jgi:hypothetical protein
MEQTLRKTWSKVENNLQKEMMMAATKPDALAEALGPRSKRVEIHVRKEIWSKFLTAIDKLGYAKPSEFFHDKVREAIATYEEKYEQIPSRDKAAS